MAKFVDLKMNGEKVLIGLSGGINSMAVLCWLKRSGVVPSELHLYYADFKEHSPDTLDFVKAGIEYAKRNFPVVISKITSNSVLEFFRSRNMIPHPRLGVCSEVLKIKPMNAYAFENDIHIDLVGYVKHEIKRRGGGQQQALGNQMDLFGGLEKKYPIGGFTDEWCFEIVDEEIGWHPAIYDILDENGKRVFKHNNCLPCKNMEIADFEAVKTHFPTFHAMAIELSEDLNAYWGRDKNEFYTRFGRNEWETDGSPCEACKF